MELQEKLKEAMDEAFKYYIITGEDKEIDVKELMDKHKGMTPDKEAAEYGHSELTFEEMEREVAKLTTQADAAGAGKSTLVNEGLFISELSDEDLKTAIFITGRGVGQTAKHNRLMDEFMRRAIVNETPEEKVARLEYLRSRESTEAILKARRGPRSTPSQKSKRKKR